MGGKWSVFLTDPSTVGAYVSVIDDAWLTFYGPDADYYWRVFLMYKVSN
jgi:hypothetical protein